MLKLDFNRNNLLKLALFGFVLTMPFAIKLNSIFVILTAVLWISKMNVVQDIRETLKQRPFITLFIFYGLYLAGLLYSSNTRAALAEIELKSTLILLPLAFTSVKLSVKECNKFLKVFIAANILASVISIAIMLYKILVLNQYQAEGQFLDVDWLLFSYSLPKQLDFHSPYFSMYTVMSAIIAAYFLATYVINNKKLLYKSVVYALVLLYLLAFTVMLSSRTALIAGLFILTVGFISYLIYSRRFLLAIGAFVVIIGTSFVVIANTPYLKLKITSNAGVDLRQRMWQGSFNVISENLLIGVGPGDVKDELTQEYQRIGFAEGVVDHLDPHNQFLQLLVALGIVGLLVFLAYLYQLLHLSLSLKMYLLTAFTFLIILCSLTESILGTQKGLVFFSFFSALFVSPKKKSYKTVEQPEVEKRIV